jgi:hypothetical protein
MDDMNTIVNVDTEVIRCCHDHAPNPETFKNTAR